MFPIDRYVLFIYFTKTARMPRPVGGEIHSGVTAILSISIN